MRISIKKKIIKLSQYISAVLAVVLTYGLARAEDLPTLSGISPLPPQPLYIKGIEYARTILLYPISALALILWVIYLFTRKNQKTSRGYKKILFISAIIMLVIVILITVADYWQANYFNPLEY